MMWFQPILDGINKSKKKVTLIVDKDGIISLTHLGPAIADFDYGIILFDNSLIFRQQYESKYRDKWDTGEKTQKLVILAKTTEAKIPYDIECNGDIIHFSLQDVFKKLDTDVLREFSSDFYTRAFDIEHSLEEQTAILTKDQTIEYICRYVWGFDPMTISDLEKLISVLIDLHLSVNEVPDIITEHLILCCSDKVPAEIDIKSLIKAKTRFFEWLRIEWHSYLKNKLHLGQQSILDFSHTALKIKIIHLISESILSAIELPDDQSQTIDELSKEDSWILLGIRQKDIPVQLTEVAQYRIVDKRLKKDFESLQSLSGIDIESFLVKTRKIAESIINDLCIQTKNIEKSLSLYEKLKALESRNILPKTTSTFFHTLRILGNIGAHETKRLELSQAEIDTILGLVTRILEWYQEQKRA